MTAIAVTPDLINKLALVAALRLCYNVEPVIEANPDIPVAIRGLNSDLSNEIIPDSHTPEENAKTLATAISRLIGACGIAGANENADKLLAAFGASAGASGALTITVPGVAPAAEPEPAGMWKVD